MKDRGRNKENSTHQKVSAVCIEIIPKGQLSLRVLA